MLVAYFDESGTHGNEANVTTVAGLVGDAREWGRLELPWQKRLGLIRCFHATDCQAQGRDFKNFTRQQSAQLFIDLATLVADRELVPVAGAVYRDDWQYGASDKVKRYLPTRFHAALGMAIIQVHNLVKEVAPSEPVALVFAQHPEYQGFTEAIHDVFRHSKHWSNMGSLTIGTPKELIPLQVADLYAYENYKELLTQLNEPGLPAPKREPLKIIHKSRHVDSRFAGIEMLHRLADSFERNEFIS
jgi:hypothetical protein